MRRLLIVAVLLAAPVAGRTEEAPASPDLTSIRLEDLMQLEVTSVSRHEEPLFRAASAITVLTAEDITRSGATSIPDLLRSVPGMDVAQINANTWAVSARGFNGQYADKMLVLVDGRTVYSPVFSGVDWDVLDVLLEDVQRIEVIRGPGATAWGANAVNGVINIITKPASTEPGMVAVARGGARSASYGGFRYAAPAGRTAEYAVFAKYQNIGRMTEFGGLPGHDGLALAHLGGRLDWQHDSRNQASVQGDVYGGTGEQRNTTISYASPYSSLVDFDGQVRGGNLMANWQHTFSAKSDLKLSTYVDRVVRPGALISQNLKTYDLDFQHRLAIGERHDFMWGGGYRIVDIDIEGSETDWFTPGHRTTQLENLFVQDAITVVPRVTVTLGSKLEHNDFSGVEAEPSARVLWSASPSQTIWGAVSRAVRTPGPVDVSVSSNRSVFPLGGGAIGVARLSGADLQSEDMTSMELGYRKQFGARFGVDLSTFQCKYTNLRGTEPGTPFFESDPAPAHMVIPVYFVNGFHGTTRGLEGTMKWRPGVRFGLTVTHSLYWMHVEHDASTPPTAKIDGGPGDIPTYQLVVQPHLSLPRHIDFDATWYHVDDLPNQFVAAYDRVDARLGWISSIGFELSAGVQNLFHDRDSEYGSISGTSANTTTRTGAFAKATWKR